MQTQYLISYLTFFNEPRTERTFGIDATTARMNALRARGYKQIIMEVQ